MGRHGERSPSSQATQICAGSCLVRILRLKLRGNEAKIDEQAGGELRDGITNLTTIFGRKENLNLIIKVQVLHLQAWGRYTTRM